MHADDIRWLFAYDRWATRRVLDVLDGVEASVWERSNAVAERGLGSILVHHLDASQRWRVGLESQGSEEGPSLERELLPACGFRRSRPRGALRLPSRPAGAWCATTSHRPGGRLPTPRATRPTSRPSPAVTDRGYRRPAVVA